MKRKKCPYCGRPVSYILRFSSRRKGEYVCTKCGKESKIVLDKKIYIYYVIAVLLSVSIMAVCIALNMTSNPLVIILVALPLAIFGLVTPEFVMYEPLKKYKKSMEAKKAGIAYSDNITSNAFLDNEKSFSVQNQEPTDNFQINSDVFNKIKKERTAARQQLQSQDISSDSSRKFDLKSDDVPIINDVSENHISTTDAPLKKIHSESRENFQ